MTNPSATALTPPTRLSIPSPSRTSQRSAASSPGRRSPGSPRPAPGHNPVSKAHVPIRPSLRRPSASSPGLNSVSDPLPPMGVISPPLSPRPEPATVHHVLETHHIQRHHNIQTGNPTINNYEILGEIGAGVHGKVKKAKDSETGTIVAIKIVNRVTKKRLGNYDPNEQENKIRREIAIMKKCHHPNIVNLIEVIDNPNSQKVYLVLEYLEKGELKWRDKNNQPILKVDQIRPIMRDVVLGLEYLHFQGIIHRDIKPGNLLMSNTGTVKISDFGVSHLAKMDEAGQPLPENDLDLAKTAGSPAFFAPELCQVDSDKPRPPITKAIDVWALGITFFCLLFGREPFPEVHGEMELYKKICNVPIEVPEDCATYLDNDTKDLLQKLLTKDSKDRITLPQVRRHPFITKGLPEPKKWIAETDLAQTSQPLEVSPAEVESAVTLFRNIVRRTFAQVKMTAKRSMSLLRPRHTPGRVISGIHVSGAISPVTLPNSPSGNLLSAGVKESSGSPKSDITANRPKLQQHAYFDVDAKGIDTFIPPTPPHSSKVGYVVPNGNSHTNGHSTKPPPPLTPPPVFPRTEHHLNDDYSNLYYSDSECGSNHDDDSDDGDRLEMKFGSRKPKI